ncbi:hypothetical protein CHF27_004150 [Romboutsia maritimum]|uniref:Uncharacterized protein n=1 Tax=Romboutsia maritimum TaxID=2020948 RepID=A0A371IUX1_9FIRM|nr:hypothetical protein [Romboutsia maritimum]RDY24282.1 hypothetical protein CHF27_004150 [Romboutsia maritimum]
MYYNKEVRNAIENMLVKGINKSDMDVLKKYPEDTLNEIKLADKKNEEKYEAKQKDQQKKVYQLTTNPERKILQSIIDGMYEHMMKNIN